MKSDDLDYLYDLYCTLAKIISQGHYKIHIIVIYRETIQHKT